MSAFGKEFKPSKNTLPRVHNLLEAELLEVLDSFQFLLVSKYPTIVWLESVPDPCQRSNLAVFHNKPLT